MSRAKAISMKLLKVSQKLGVTNQTILIRFFHERLLYRVSVSPFKEKLLLKGGNLMYLFLGNKTRPTVDIDFSGQQLTNEIEKIRTIFTDILSIPANDEVLFVTDRMNISPINEQNKYIGIRIKVNAVLGNIRQNIQIDIGYGDIISPAPVSINYPVLLKEFEAPVILAYTVETVIAEKLQAIMELA